MQITKSTVGHPYTGDQSAFSDVVVFNLIGKGWGVFRLVSTTATERVEKKLKMRLMHYLMSGNKTVCHKMSFLCLKK